MIFFSFAFVVLYVIGHYDPAARQASGSTSTAIESVAVNVLMDRHRQGSNGQRHQRKRPPESALFSSQK
jgi:hypothetical protein